MDKIFTIINLINNRRSSVNSNQLQEENNNIFYRQLIADNLSKYSEKISQLKDNTEPKIQEITRAASLAYDEIVSQIDIYDSKRANFTSSEAHSDKHLRHIAVDIIKLWYHNYSHRIGVNCGSLIDEMKEIIHIRPEENDTDSETKLSLIQSISVYAAKALNSNTEDEKSKSARSHPELFNSLLSAYFERISDKQKLYDESIAIAKPVFDQVRNLKGLFEDNCEEIEKCLQHNKVENVGIEEHPELYNSLIRYRACMMFLSDFFIIEQDISYEAQHLKVNQVLEILLFLFILKIYGIWEDPSCCPI